MEKDLTFNKFDKPDKFESRLDLEFLEKGRDGFYTSYIQSLSNSLLRDEIIDYGNDVDYGYEDFSSTYRLQPLDFSEAPTFGRNFSTPEQTVAPTAHRFRTRRLKQGAVGEFVSSIRSDNVGHATIKSFTELKHVLNGREKDDATPDHRALSPFLAGIMSHEEFRTSFMSALNETATAESDALKEQARDGLKVDVLIVGAGAQGSVAAARLRAENPELSVLAVDESEQLGGQFRSYGTRPTFRINSRAHRVANTTDEAALPGGERNLNPFSEVSVMQLPDITTETYPTNTDMGDAIAVNQFFSTPTMLGVKFMSRAEKSGLEAATLKDVRTQEEYPIQARKIIILAGSGEREPTTESDNVWSAEDLLRHFGNENDAFPMKKFIGKSIAVVGGGDSGRIVVELLTRLGPKQAYGNSVAQLGGPESVAWYGVDFGSREEFCAKTRSRYQQIGPFIADSNEPTTPARPILPKQSKVVDVREQDSGAVALTDSEGQRRFYDIVIDARTLKSRLDDIDGTDNLRLDYPSRDVPIQGIGVTAVGKLIDRTQVYVGGPAASTRLTPQELASFPDTIKENTVALWANSPRVDELARDIAGQLTRS